MSELQTAVMNLVREQINLGSAMFEAVTGQPLSRFTAALSPRMLPAAGCGCTIPPPCWLPQPLGECTSHTSDCKSAALDLAVTNTAPNPRRVSIRISGIAPGVRVEPQEAVIEPFDTVTFRLSVDIPQKTPQGLYVNALVMIHGCKTHYLRWKVSVGTIGFSSCHEIAVDDGPDLIHHWYDHFYCPRPCPGGDGR